MLLHKLIPCNVIYCTFGLNVPRELSGQAVPSFAIGIFIIKSNV